MKQLIAHTLTSLLLTVGFLAGTVQGQASSDVVKVNIPFEFNVGNKTFPAGRYSLVEPFQHFLVLRDARGQSIASTFTVGVESASPVAVSKLKFESVAGRYTLTEVWQQEKSWGQRVPVNHRTILAKQRSPEPREPAEGSQP
jgi:hypothetical protein